MYNEYIDSEVVVIVSSRAKALWEYTGVLVDVDEKFLKLKNVEIKQMMLNFKKKYVWFSNWFLSKKYKWSSFK